ncbi:hypothetical protein [Clostridium manihotivorum]|uniref:Uncharacterized protein n=1 Tax=Clostridium manihotivorum TaxID=2320868 RepID=A0A3R5QWS6_9CLOT|nr:hypothetical protein [Clostridium manihotivorum]QAA31341.1 hypothetical protein C1I91_06620 [Clostridium manihotivorum]
MTRKKSKSFAIDKDDLAYEEDVEMNGFIEDTVVGTPVATFNFCEEASDAPSDNRELVSITKDNLNNKIHLNVTNTNVTKANSYNVNDNNTIIDNRTLKSQPNGVTPPIDGEAFVITRTFKFRVSTARILNEIKAAHPDPNAYLSTIIDSAIKKYHDYIFKEGGTFL